jgi:restriction system protein
MKGTRIVTSYYRVRLGIQGSGVDECVDGGFLGVYFGIREDLTNELPDDWREFNRRFIPQMIAGDPTVTKIGAGLMCGMLWTTCKGLNEGDVVISPTNAGMYHVGTVTGPYEYSSEGDWPHRRPVTWRSDLVARADMSEDLRRSTGTPGTIVNITRHAAELERLLNEPGPVIIATDPTVEDAATFALEKHLEDFLVANWASTDLGRGYRIYEVDGERVGQQFPTDTGPIDILAISHDGTELLVVELKRGRASDSVVGQIQRYMGYVAQDLAEPTQRVRGAIIALEDDLRVRRALAVAPNIDFYRYTVQFHLHRV